MDIMERLTTAVGAAILSTIFGCGLFFDCPVFFRPGESILRTYPALTVSASPSASQIAYGDLPSSTDPSSLLTAVSVAPVRWTSGFFALEVYDNSCYDDQIGDVALSALAGSLTLARSSKHNLHSPAFKTCAREADIFFSFEKPPCRFWTFVLDLSPLNSVFGIFWDFFVDLGFDQTFFWSLIVFPFAPLFAFVAPFVYLWLGYSVVRSIYSNLVAAVENSVAVLSSLLGYITFVAPLIPSDIIIDISVVTIGSLIIWFMSIRKLMVYGTLMLFAGLWALWAVHTLAKYVLLAVKSSVYGHITPAFQLFRRWRNASNMAEMRELRAELQSLRQGQQADAAEIALLRSDYSNLLDEVTTTTAKAATTETVDKLAETMKELFRVVPAASISSETTLEDTTAASLSELACRLDTIENDRAAEKVYRKSVVDQMKKWDSGNVKMTAVFFSAIFNLADDDVVGVVCAFMHVMKVEINNLQDITRRHDRTLPPVPSSPAPRGCALFPTQMPANQPHPPVPSHFGYSTKYHGMSPPPRPSGASWSIGAFPSSRLTLRISQLFLPPFEVLVLCEGTFWIGGQEGCWT